MGQHPNIKIKGLLVEIVDSVGVDNGGVEEDIGVLGTVEEGGGVVEATERGVRALELEAENWVAVEAMADEESVDWEELGDGFGFVDQ